MVTSFSQFTPIKVKKISAPLLGKVKKIEAQMKKLFSLKKRVVTVEKQQLLRRDFSWGL